MYPNTYVNLFPPFPRDNRVFVAMSFHPRFDARWQNVLVPAVNRVVVNESRLEPHRVDLRKASDSVLTEILDGIGRCRFFLADITTVGELDGRPMRNGNVLYEVGLAHAMRLPEEVVLLRSDTQELLFDVMNIRVLQYDPDGAPTAAQEIVADAIVQSLRELELARSLSVRRVAHSLDVHSWFLLFEIRPGSILHHPPVRTMGQALGGITRRQAIDRLLQVGALRADFTKLTPELLAASSDRPMEELVGYKITELGAAVAEYGIRKLGFDSPEIQRLLEERGASQSAP